jgi:hypothetical protein
LNGVISDEETETEVVRFILENKLREDEADDLIDALSEREGGGQLRFPMSLGQMKFDRTAAATIKHLHVTHRSRVERQVAQGIEANYKRLLEASTRAIDEWWEQAINRPNGLNYAQRFVDKLLVKIQWYQGMMESESKEERKRLKFLKFDTHEEQVVEAGSAFLSRERKVTTACENYKGVVDRESDLQQQMTRRDKAAEFYGALRTYLESIVTQCARIRLNLEATLNAFERLYLDITSNRSGENPFEQVVRFNAEASQPKISAEDFVRWHSQQHGSLTLWANVRDEHVQNEIMAYVKECYRPLTGLSIDDVLQRSTTESIPQDLKQLDALAEPLWRYEEGKIPVVNRSIIDEMYLYGVGNTDQTVLKDPKVHGSLPQGTNAPSLVSTLDSQRITLFKVKIGVPLFALQGIDEMERAYNDPDKTVSNHLHRGWESFPNLIPRGGDGDALRWFAIAQAPTPFGLIARRGEWYYILSKQAKRTDNGELKLGQGRLNAFQGFEKNRELIKEVEERVDVIAHSKGQEEITKTLRDYGDGLQKQMAGGNIDQSIKEQVEGELQSIDDYLSRIATIR